MPEITTNYCASCELLQRLATCGCGDGFTAQSPGTCANCLAVQIGALSARIDELEKMLRIRPAHERPVPVPPDPEPVKRYQAPDLGRPWSWSPKSLAEWYGLAPTRPIDKGDE